MGPGEYAAAIAWLLAIAAVLAFAAGRARRALCAGWSGPPARLVDAVLAVAILLLASELVGLFGWFTRAGILLGVAALAGSTALAAARLGPSGSYPPPPPPAPGRLACAAAIAVVSTLAAIWAGPVLQSLDVGMYRQDSTWYHLTFSANFFQTAHTGGLLFTDPLRLAAWFYPQNSELLHAVGMVAFGRDFLSPAINVGWAGLSVLAAWCLGRPFGQGAAAVVAASILLGSNMMQAQAGNAPSDMPALAFLLATIAILVNAQAAGASGAGRGPFGLPPGPLFAAGLAAGLAAGTKVTLLVPIGVLTVAMAFLAPRGRRGPHVATWLAGVALTGAFWYGRNAVHAGNPLPWVGFGFLPSPDQLPIYPRPPHSILDYLASPGAWADWFIPGLHDALGPLWPPILLAVAAGLVLGLRRRGDPLLRAVAAAGIAAALAYLAIPIAASGPDGVPYGFGSNLRYLAPALLAGLVALVPIAARSGVAPWLNAGLVAAFATVALNSDSWGLSEEPAALLLALVLVAAPLALTRLARRGASRAVLALGVLGAALLLAALAYPAQRGYTRHRYLAALMPPSANPGFRSADQWQAIQDWARRQSNRKIGIAGPSAAFGQYIFYGDDLSNQVRYIGQPGAHGSYTPIDNCQGWRWAVAAGGFDYVVITPDPQVGPTAEAQETYWTRTDPGARQVIAAPPAAVFRIRRGLDPRACLAQPPAAILPVPWGGIAMPRGGPGAAPGAPGGTPGGPLIPTHSQVE